MPAHLESVIARLTSLRAGDDRTLGATIDSVVRELDAARAGAKNLRGQARSRLLERLRTLEQELSQAARSRFDAATLRAIETEAAGELAPFRDRMPADAYQRAHVACVDRIVRNRARLPVLTFE